MIGAKGRDLFGFDPALLLVNIRPNLLALHHSLLQGHSLYARAALVTAGKAGPQWYL